METTKNKLKDLKNAQEQLDKNIKSGTDVDKKQYRLLQREIVQTEKNLKDLNKQAMQGGLDQAAKSAKNLAIGAGAVAGTVITVGSALKNVTDETREYREDMNKLETAFVTSGKTAESAKNIYSEFYKVLGEEDRSVEAVNHLAALTNNEEELAQWGDICAGVTAKFGDSLPIEGLTEAANETAKVGKVTGPLADALNWAGVSEDEFNEKLARCNSEQERATLITSTLNNTYSEEAAKYKELNGDIMENREQTQRLTEAKANFAAKVEPIMNKVNGIIATLAEKAMSFGGWIIDNGNIILPIIAAIGAAFVVWNVAGIIQGVSSALNAFKLANDAATISQALLNAVMNLNPFVLIATLIAAVVAAVIALWNTNEGFRNAVIGIWDSIKSGIGKAIDGIKKFFTETLPNAFKTCLKFIQDNWQNILLFITNPIAGAIAFLYKFNPKFKEWVDNVINNIKEWFLGMVDVGKNFIEGLWNGIGDKVEWLKGKVKGVVDKIKSWFTGSDGFDIHSPSRWAKTVGDFLMQGLAEGITKDMSAEQATKQKLDNIKKFITDNIESIQNEVSNKRTAFADKLKDGNLYNKDIFVFGEKSEEVLYLHDFGNDTQALINYSNLLAKVENRLNEVSSDIEMNHTFMQLIRDMGLEDGTKFMNTLMGAGDKDFSEYIEGWQVYQKTADIVAAQTYSTEARQLKEGFLGEVEKGLSGVVDSFSESGKDSATSFGIGFMEKIRMVMAEIQEMLQGYNSSFSLSGQALSQMGSTTTTSTTNNDNRSTNITINNQGSSVSAYEERVQINKLFNQMKLQGVL